MKETEIAKPIVQYILDLGWEVYQEVQIYQFGNIADIVGVKDKRLTWVIETKRSLNLNLIAQAEKWTFYSHWVSVATPRPKRGRYSDGSAIASRVLDWLGIGCIEVELGKSRSYVQDYKKPRLNRKAMADKILNVLTEEHKTFAQAGNANGKRWSPWRDTCCQVERFINKNPGATLKNTIESIDHHYSSDMSARISMARWIREGKIPGIKVVKNGRVLTLHPTKEEELK